MTKRLFPILAVAFFTASGCNLIYKQNIQQGNALEDDAIEQLRIGMSMNQVAFLMGTPSIQDPFHHDRWDYVSTFSRRGQEPTLRKISLRFEDGVLVEMDGVDDEGAASADGGSDPQPVAKAGVRESADGGEEGRAENEPEVTPLRTPEATDTVVEESASAAGQADEDGAESPAAVFEPAGPSDDPVPTAPAPQAAAAQPDPAVPPELTGGWTIQLGAFDDRANALRMQERLAQAGYDSTIEERPGPAGPASRFLVRKTGITSRAEAIDLLETIQIRLGINGFLVPLEN